MNKNAIIKTFSLRRSFITLITVMIVTFVASVALNMHLTDELKRINDQTLILEDAAADGHELQFHAVQIQQFLTDVSATSDRGGFEEAAAHFKTANELLNNMATDVPELSNQLNDVRIKLDALHETGKQMAETYIAKGQAAGNIVMKLPNTGFDDRSLTFVAALDKITRYLDSKSLSLNELNTKKTSQLGLLIGAVNLVASLLLFIIVFNLGRKLMKALGGEPMDAVNAAKEIAEGNLESPIKLKSYDSSSLLYTMSTMQKELQAFMAEQNNMIVAVKKGNIDTTLNANRFHGSFRVMAENSNEMAQNQAELLRKVTHCLDEFANGKFNAYLEQFPGDLAFVNKAVEELRRNLNTIDRKSVV